MKKYLLLLILSLFPLASFAEVYKWIDANGKTHFGDDKEAKTATATEATTPVVVDIKTPNAYTPTKKTPGEIEQEQIREMEKQKQQEKEQEQEKNNDGSSSEAPPANNANSPR